VSADTSIEYPRFKWFVAGQIADAPHPDLSGGLQTLASFLREQGIGGIVTLCERPLEPNVESLGFDSLFVETPDFRPPSDLARILAFIDTQVEQGRGILVHCFAGIGRTGTVLAAWLLRQEYTLSAGEAIERVRESYIPEYARNRFPEHPSQSDALEKFARTQIYPFGPE
jgi:atypical dual specificity phosphatase